MSSPGRIFERVSAEALHGVREGMQIVLQGVRYRVGKYLPQQDDYMLTYLERLDAMAFPGESWESGDVVLDTHGDLYVRAHEQSVRDGWPWSTGCHGGTSGPAPEGGVGEDHPARPLTLLVRGGKKAVT